MNGLETLDLKQPSLTDRLLRRKPKENLYRELQNYLAATPLLATSRDGFNKILSTYKTDLDEARPALVSLYAQITRHFADDLHFNANENQQLQHLRDLFSLSQREIDEVTDKVLLPLLQTAAKDRLDDKHLTTEEKGTLQLIVESLNIPEHKAKAIYATEAHRILQAELESAVTDRRLSAAEEAQLDSIAANLGIVMHYDHATESLLERYKLLWRISQGELPLIDTPILLQKNGIIPL